MNGIFTSLQRWSTGHFIISISSRIHNKTTVKEQKWYKPAEVGHNVVTDGRKKKKICVCETKFT